MEGLLIVDCIQEVSFVAIGSELLVKHKLLVKFYQVKAFSETAVGHNCGFEF